MKKMAKVIAGTVLASAMVCTVAATSGCGSSTTEINIDGSTSVQPLMEVLAENYMSAHSDVIINITGNGSGTGITDAQNGTVDFAMSSRDLKSSETGVTSMKIATDGIAAIVSTSCTVDDVTVDELKALYESGTAIQNTIVAAVSREEGSGTRDAWEELVGIESLYSGTGFDQYSSTSAVVSAISTSTGSTVGYISLGSLDSSVKALKIGGVEATAANVAAGSYAISRPFNIVYNTTNGLSEAAQDFIDYIMGSEGQAIVTAQGYISIL